MSWRPPKGSTLVVSIIFNVGVSLYSVTSVANTPVKNAEFRRDGRQILVSVKFRRVERRVLGPML